MQCGISRTQPPSTGAPRHSAFVPTSGGLTTHVTLVPTPHIDVPETAAVSPFAKSNTLATVRAHQKQCHGVASRTSSNFSDDGSHYSVDSDVEFRFRS